MAEYVRDPFSRLVGSGWGTADIGGAWAEVLSNCTTSVIGSSQARASFSGVLAGAADERIAGSASALNAMAACSFPTYANWLTPAGAWSTFVTLFLRASGTGSSTAGYFGRLEVKPDGAMVLSVGYSLTGTLVPLATVAYPAGTTIALRPWRLEVETVDAPTKIRARIYRTDLAIPAGNQGWLIAADDVGPQVAGAYAVRVSRTAPPLTATQFVDLLDYYATDPPVPDFTYTASGLTATFATTGTTGDFTAYSWDWGDGTTAGTGSTPSHAYASGGTYLVTLTGTTRWGSKFTGTGYVSVAAPPPAPPELVPSVKIAGVEVCDSVYSVTWNLGRESWWQPIAGQTCSIRLRGIFSAAPGQAVTIAVPSAVSGVPLWVGTIDQVTEVNEIDDARDDTMVIAMDQASQLARQHLDKGSILGTKDLPGRLADLVPPGRTVKYRYRYSTPVYAGRWLPLKLKVKADKLSDRTYLDLVSDALNASFAFGYTARDGAISYAPIESPAEMPSTPRIDLNTGLDCASRVTLDRNNLDGIINRWKAGSDEYESVKRDSIDLYGERAYTVPADVLSDPQSFPFGPINFLGLYNNLAIPVRAAQVEVPVTDWDQKVITASPLDFATWNSKVYSIVGIRHEINVGDAWRCTLNLDRNPWEMDGSPVP